MKHVLAVPAIWFCFTSLSPAADQQLIGLMMPDAKVLAGANLSQVLTSPYGQYVLGKIPTGDPEFQQFIQATGFDPTRDISQVVAASPGVPGQHIGLVAARGTFDAARIVSFLKSNAGATVDESLGVPMVTSPDGKGAFAFLDSTLAVAGDAGDVAAAIGRRSSPSMLDPALIAKADTLSASQDAWIVSTVSASTIVAGAPAVPGGFNLAALQTIQQASASVKFGTSVNVSAEAIEDTPQNANALADIVRMLVALAQMNQSNPGAAQLAAALKSLTISTKGTSLELSLAIPEDLIEQLSPAGKGHRAHLAERGK